MTDLATDQSHSLFTQSQSANELYQKMTVFLNMHPQWRITSTPTTPYFIRVDPESNCNSEMFLYLLGRNSYVVERTLPRGMDKHANGVAERTVGLMTTKTNVAMLALTPNVPS